MFEMTRWMAVAALTSALACGSPSAPFERTERTVIHGRAHQVLQAGPYTYVLVGQGETALWVATLQQDLLPGTAVDVTVLGRRENFHSKRLERTFEQLAFGMVHNAQGASNDHQ